MKDARKIRSLVKAILLEDEKARNSDKELYIQVVNVFNPEYAYQPLTEALRNKELPNFDTVTRARRWAQAKFPDLRAKKSVQERRELEEEEYKEAFR